MKVLSIDIDYAFPTVDHWPNEDNEMFSEWHPYTKWYEYFLRYPHLNTRENIINDQCLDYLIETFTKALSSNPNAHVWFGMDHDYILSYLHDKDNIEIVNIDHHDDFLAGCYVGQQHGDDEQLHLGGYLTEYIMAKAHGKVDEGSWGSYLHSQGKLKSMIWIRNDDGTHNDDTRTPYNQFLCKNLGTPCEWETMFAEEYDHGDYQYDAIFVCLSPSYLPTSQWHLFSLFLGIYEDFTGKSCKLDEFWDKKWMTKMGYGKAREILKESLDQVKKSFDK
jgi:hypothetical protein